MDARLRSGTQMLVVRKEYGNDSGTTSRHMQLASIERGQSAINRGASKLRHDTLGPLVTPHRQIGECRARRLGWYAVLLEATCFVRSNSHGIGHVNVVIDSSFVRWSCYYYCAPPKSLGVWRRRKRRVVSAARADRARKKRTN